MAQLKAIVFGLSNIAYQLEGRKGIYHERYTPDFFEVVKRLIEIGITPIVVSNSSWTIDGKPAQEALSKIWGNIPWYSGLSGKNSAKQKKGVVADILVKHGFEPGETLYLANSMDDCLAAWNSNIPFIRGAWFNGDWEKGGRARGPYGWEMNSPAEFDRFIHVFCRREHFWGKIIEEENWSYYTMAQCSTYSGLRKAFSKNAISTAKDGIGDPDFWGQMLASTLYFSGLHGRGKLMCPFPSSTAGQWSDTISDQLEMFQKATKALFSRDLLVRHTTVGKSRNNKGSANHAWHLNSMMLNANPLGNSRARDKRFKDLPINPGDEMFVVDDFCTRGHSLDSARYLLNQAGFKPIMVSWLKFNGPYSVATEGPELDPFTKNNTSDYEFTVVNRGFDDVDADCDQELANLFQKYKDWKI